MEGVNGAQFILPPRPGSGPRFQTLIIVELTGEGTLGDLTKAVEDAETVHRAEILPGVATAITGKLKPETDPEAITEALQKAGLFEEPEVPEQDQDAGG